MPTGAELCWASCFDESPDADRCRVLMDPRASVSVESVMTLVTGVPIPKNCSKEDDIVSAASTSVRPFTVLVAVY